MMMMRYANRVVLYTLVDADCHKLAALGYRQFITLSVHLS